MDSLKKSLTRSYRQEDIREIMNIALVNHSAMNPDLSHPQLLEIAQELNISPDSIELAQRSTDLWQVRPSLARC